MEILRPHQRLQNSRICAAVALALVVVVVGTACRAKSYDSVGYADRMPRCEFESPANVVQRRSTNGTTQIGFVLGNTGGARLIVEEHDDCECLASDAGEIIIPARSSAFIPMQVDALHGMTTVSRTFATNDPTLPKLLVRFSENDVTIVAAED